MPVLVPNQRVEKWTITRLLAQGGQGAVYEAFREDIGQRGALKVLISPRTTPAVLERFIREARAVNAIKHPGIPQVIDHGVFADGAAWMVMEFLEGETLESRLSKRRVSRDEALAIAQDVASALDAAHRKNIIHRDIKPSNIMLVPDDDEPNGERAMVLDFGIAKLLESEALTNTGHMVGTPIYMAYEQGLRAKDVDGRSDVYSLGVVLYQMLTRRAPFRFSRDGGPLAVLAAKTEPSTPIEKYAPNLPAELRTLVNAMVQKDRKLRPTMPEVRATLRHMQGLPPARQTGSHDALGLPTVEPTPVHGAFDYDEEEEDPTGSAESSLISLQEVGPTPNARGEISPAKPPIQVPKSISDQPSLPVRLPDPSLNVSPELPAPGIVPLFAPIDRVGPEESTARPAPTQLIAQANATPNSSTMFAGVPPSPAPPKEDEPSRRRVASWAGGVLALSGIITVLVLQRPRQQPTVKQGQFAVPAIVDLGQPVPLRAQVSPPDLAAPPDLLEPPEKARPTTRSKCPAKLVDASCMLTPMMARQREALMTALRENGGVRLCPGEHIVITGLPAHPAMQAPASWLKRQTPDLFIDALHGLDGSFPAKVEIVCSK